MAVYHMKPSYDSITVLIPAKSHSVRLPEKNIRPFFNGKSLLEIKIHQVKQLFHSENIVVSSEDPGVFKLVRSSGVRFHLRSIDYSSGIFTWQDSFREIVETINDDHILIAFATTPFVNQHVCKELIDTYFSLLHSHDCLIGVKRIQSKLFTSSGAPFNFGRGSDYKGSQDIPPLFAWPRGISLIRTSVAKAMGLDLGTSPFMYELNQIQSIDIDCQADWELALAVCDTEEGVRSLGLADHQQQCRDHSMKYWGGLPLFAAEEEKGCQRLFRNTTKRS